MAAILASLHMRTADDLFGGPQGSPLARPERTMGQVVLHPHDNAERGHVICP